MQTSKVKKYARDIIWKEEVVYNLGDKDYLVVGNMWIGKILLADPDNNNLLADVNARDLEYYVNDGSEPIGIVVMAKSDEIADLHNLHGEFTVIAVSDVKLLLKGKNGFTRVVYPSRLKLVE